MTTAKDELADLRNLVGERLTETVEGRDLVLQPFAFQQLPHMLELIQQAKGFMAFADGALDVDVFGLISQQYDTALDALQTMSGQDEEWLRALPSDTALFLLAAYVRVNADFFIRRLAPLVMQALTSLAPSASVSAGPSTESPTAAAADGAMSSPS